MAATAAKSAVAQVLLYGACPVPITSLGRRSSSGITKSEKWTLVCLCHAPPSSSCMLSIHSRFQRVSFSMSGVPLPLSGIFSLMLFTLGPKISHVHSSVPVVIPEFTT